MPRHIRTDKSFDSGSDWNACAGMPLHATCKGATTATHVRSRAKKRSVLFSLITRQVANG